MYGTIATDIKSFYVKYHLEYIASNFGPKVEEKNLCNILHWKECVNALLIYLFLYTHLRCYRNWKPYKMGLQGEHWIDVHKGDIVT